MYRKNKKKNIYQAGYMRKDGRKIDKIRDLILFDWK